MGYMLYVLCDCQTQENDSCSLADRKVCFLMSHNAATDTCKYVSECTHACVHSLEMNVHKIHTK